MKVLFFLLLPFYCFAQIEVQIAEGITMTITRLPDTLELRSFDLSPGWAHKKYRKYYRSYPKEKNATASIKFKGSGIEIYTLSLKVHEGYNVLLDGEVYEIEIDHSQKNNYPSFTINDLPPGVHDLKIYGDIYAFAVNYVVIHYDNLKAEDINYKKITHD